MFGGKCSECLFEIFYIFTQLIESVKIQIGIEIAQGLDYMHTRDPAVIHQDIKPENIMVSIFTSMHHVSH